MRSTFKAVRGGLSHKKSGDKGDYWSQMVTVDQLSVRTDGSIGTMALANMLYEAENRKGRKP